jgi:NADH-quinone oxidoreductase subunit L
MLSALWLVPALPLAGFLALALFGRWMRRALVAVVGVGSVGAATVVMTAVAIAFVRGAGPGAAVTEELWTWLALPTLDVRISLYLDALSLVMALVVAWVGFLIHLYSVEFMEGDEGVARFFAYMNLFVASMLLLLLAKDLLFTLLGWEGVGLCSYLLIGFWYRDPQNGYAARKAFVVTRVGDTSLLVGLFLLASQLGTLDIQTVLERAQHDWPSGTWLPELAAALILGGAVGKSAQLPLQTWLPDAMAGPTPVSALIHAATMVTAGVYLIARTHTLFTLAPAVLFAVGVVGAATLLLAGCAALVQRDIKRVLAYSTISQIGYMFLGLGAGAWGAAIFHFMTHAFFKALLFLSAGAVISSLYHEHDIYKMGGLRKKLPLTFWTFLIGSASLAGFPVVTAGFFSKDLILSRVLSSPLGGTGLWLAGVVGVFLTALYIFRVVFVVFFGEPARELERSPHGFMHVPLLVLAVLAVVGGYLETPAYLGGVHVFSLFLETSLPSGALEAGVTCRHELLAEAPVTAAALLGIGVSALLFLGRRRWVAAAVQTRIGRLARDGLEAGWGFDALYDRLLVKPFSALATLNQRDVIDGVYTGLARVSLSLHRVLGRTENGLVRSYAAGVAFGAVVLVAVVVLL